MKDKSKWFVCECSGEAIRVERYDDDDIPSEFWFSLYRIGNWNPSLSWKIKAAWKVLTTGSIHEDQVTFSIKTTRRLNDYLTKELSK